MNLERKLFCLYFSPLLVVTLLNLGFYILLFEQIKSIISDQEEKIYFDQQTSKKQILMGVKAHLDQSFSLQSHEYYILSKFITKNFQNKIILNNGFIQPVYNIERFIGGNEDPQFTQLYNRSPILSSVWANDPIQVLSQLPAETYDQFKKGAVFDLLIRSYNLLNSQRTFKYTIQFFGFSQSGLLLANPGFNNSLNDSFQSQSLCTEKVYYNATCRSWFRQTLLSKTSYILPPLKILAQKDPFMALSLCRSSETNNEVTTIACQALKIDQVAHVFSRLELQTGGFRVIHPSSGDLIYSKSISDYQQHHKWETEMSANMTQSESAIFLQRMNEALTRFSSSTADGLDFSEYLNSIKLQNVNGFEFEQQGEKQYCLLIPISISDKPNGVDTSSTTFSNAFILMYNFRKGEMVQEFSDVQAYLANIFMANSMFYLIMLVLCIVIIIYYTKTFTKLIEVPMSNLIDKIGLISAFFFDTNSSHKQPQHYQHQHHGMQAQQQDILLIIQNKSNRSHNFHHTCKELTQLGKYISRLQEIYNYNLNYSSERINDTSALFVCVKAIKHFENDHDAKALGIALNNLANIHFNNSRYLSALECFSHSLVCLEQEKNEAVTRAKLLSEEKKKENQLIAKTDNNSEEHFLGITKQRLRLIVSATSKIFLKLLQKELNFLSPWIKKHFKEELSPDSSRDYNRSREMQNLQMTLVSLDSLRFDRQFAYSQVMLACYLDHEFEGMHSKERQANSMYAPRNEMYLHILENAIQRSRRVDSKHLAAVLNQPQDITHINSQFRHLQARKGKQNYNNTQIINKQHACFSNQAILSEYEDTLKKLLIISSELSNDPTRSILVYIEISKLLLLKLEVEPARKYFTLAMKLFLEIYKGIATVAATASHVGSNPFSYSQSQQNHYHYHHHHNNQQQQQQQQQSLSSSQYGVNCNRSLNSHSTNNYSKPNSYLSALSTHLLKYFSQDEIHSSNEHHTHTQPITRRSTIQLQQQQQQNPQQQRYNFQQPQMQLSKESISLQQLPLIQQQHVPQQQQSQVNQTQSLSVSFRLPTAVGALGVGNSVSQVIGASEDKVGVGSASAGIALQKQTTNISYSPITRSDNLTTTNQRQSGINCWSSDATGSVSAPLIAMNQQLLVTQVQQVMMQPQFDPIVEEDLDSQENAQIKNSLKKLMSAYPLSQPFCLSIAEFPLKHTSQNNNHNYNVNSTTNNYKFNNSNHMHNRSTGPPSLSNLAQQQNIPSSQSMIQLSTRRRHSFSLKSPQQHSGISNSHQQLLLLTQNHLNATMPAAQTQYRTLQTNHNNNNNSFQQLRLNRNRNNLKYPQVSAALSATSDNNRNTSQGSILFDMQTQQNQQQQQQQLEESRLRSFTHPYSIEIDPMLDVSMKELVTQLDALHLQVEAGSDVHWTQKTSYVYPIDILFTKLQLHEAVLDMVENLCRDDTLLGNKIQNAESISQGLNNNNNYEKEQQQQQQQQQKQKQPEKNKSTSRQIFESGSMKLIEAFELAPRYLASDRMILLNLLERSMGVSGIDTSLVTKQINKFKGIKLKVTVIVSSAYSERELALIANQIYEVFKLTHTFSLLVITESGEQYIPPVNQSYFKSKEIFLNTIRKYLTLKKIVSNRDQFLAALSKASCAFLERMQKFPLCNAIEQESMKQYVLVLGNFEESLFEEAHVFFSRLERIEVKVLMYSPDFMQDFDNSESHRDGEDEIDEGDNVEEQLREQQRYFDDQFDGKQTLRIDSYYESKQAKQFDRNNSTAELAASATATAIHVGRSNGRKKTSRIVQAAMSARSMQDGYGKLRTFLELSEVISYLKRKVISCNTQLPFLVEKI